MSKLEKVGTEPYVHLKDLLSCSGPASRRKLSTGLLHELFRVNQTYNSPATVVYITKNAV